MTEPKPFFPGIHALRFLAATLVVIEHAGATANDYTLAGYSILIPHFYFGRVGVVLFFAISGFVIALQRKKPIFLFIQHRLLRIYPSYWIACAVAAVLLWLVKHPVGRPSVAALLLYPSDVGDGTLTIPYWTLVFEVTFYALAAVAFGFRLTDRTLTVFAVLWIVAVNLFGHDGADSAAYSFPGATILLAPVIQVFPLGLICGIHFSTLRRAGRWPLLIGAALAYFAGVPFAEFSTAKLLGQGISAACLVGSVADLGVCWRGFLAWIGDAAYGIYLIHFPIIYALDGAGYHGARLFVVVAMAGGVAFGRLDYRLYRQLTFSRAPAQQVSAQAL